MKNEKILWKNRLTVKIPITMAMIILVVIVAMCSCLSLLASTTVTKMTEKELNYIAEDNAKEVLSYLDSMAFSGSVTGASLRVWRQSSNTIISL